MTALFPLPHTELDSLLRDDLVAASLPSSVDAAIERHERALAPVSAPTDRELFAYLGPQRRWVMLAMTIAFGVAGVSVVKFSAHSAWLFPLLVVLGVNVVGALMSLATGQRRRLIDRDSHVTRVRSWSPDVLPSVDVFLPTCGEPLDILANTYRHVAEMHWDGPLRVLVLDDGNRDDVRQLAALFGFEYIVRPNRGHMKKAGNLAHAYGRTSGDLIVIFDADFCPRHDFLGHLVPYFDDERAGIVQSPQCFDTTTNMSWLQRTAGATQEIFYRWVQPSRDRAGAPVCVGTNAVYRRAALDAVGGFAQIEHSEDIHTGIALLNKGFVTTYVPVQLAKGLCPDDLAAFMNQQYRWCNGSLTSLKPADVRRHPLSLRQRLCFWSGAMYYLTTALNVFALFVPAMVMAVFYPREIRPSHYLPFFAGVWVYAVLLPRVSRTRWRFEVLRVQMVYSFCHAVAIAHKVLGRSAGWVPTGAMKGGNPLARTIGRLGFSWLALVMVVSWGALAWDGARYGFVDLWPMAIFLLGYSYLSLPLLYDFGRLLLADRAARRAAVRSAEVAA